MVEITASMVKELRDRTGLGMMECKKFLKEAGGDLEAAELASRKAGAAKAAKKADRATSEGLVAVAVSDDSKSAALVLVACETDFVARNEDFQAFVQNLADLALSSESDSVEAFNQVTFSSADDRNVETVRADMVAKIGENIQIKEVSFLSSDGMVGAYVHGGRIGALVATDGSNLDLAKDLAMQVAASAPQVVSPEDVSEALVAQEKEVFSAQAQASGKPEDIIEKMVVGRLNKFRNEVSLTGQPFVKDPNTTVDQLLKAANVTVKQFIRSSIG